MAPSISLAALLLAVALLISPSLSQKCSSKKTASQYTNCTDLPTLNATLHWNYTAADSTLLFSFSATPVKSGWAAWGINPNGTGMRGAFGFLAFSDQNTGVIVKQYNLTVNSKNGITEVKNTSMPWTVQNLTAVSGSGGAIEISATLKNISKRINHLWQVGPSVQAGIPKIHSFGSENMNSIGTLELSTGKSVAPAASPADAPASGGGTIPASPASVESPTGTGAGSSFANRRTNMDLYTALVGIAGLLVF